MTKKEAMNVLEREMKLRNIITAQYDVIKTILNSLYKKEYNIWFDDFKIEISDYYNNEDRIINLELY